MQSKVALKVFFSYSHKDESLCFELLKHLTPLKQADLIESWYDRQITPGEDWDKEIKTKINESDIILFLISPDFLSSKYIYENEVKAAIERHKNGKAIVVPIMLRKCDVEYTLFKEIQGLPTDFEPILSKKWYSIDDAYFDVTIGLKKIIRKVQQKKQLSRQIDHSQHSVQKTKTNYDYYFTQIKKFINLFGTAEDLKFKNVILNSQLQFMQSEKEEISTEIHDNIGQLLSVARMILNKKLAEDTHNTEDIEKVRDIISNAANYLRQLSHRLHTDNFQIDFDLKESLLQLESYFLSISSIRFQFSFQAIDSIKRPRLEVNIFRIIQELLNNVISHSNATYCSILVKRDSGNLIIEINDNGKGFGMNESTEGMGLSNIKSRVSYYYGNMAINSNKNNGTNINISIPMR